LDLPQITKVVKGKGNLAAFGAWIATFGCERPLSLPHGTPKGRIKILSMAYAATLHAPEFLAEARKSKFIINYVS